MAEENMGFLTHRSSQVIDIVFAEAILVGWGVSQIIQSKPGFQKAFHKAI
jgi:hypothetical protein